LTRNNWKQLETIEIRRREKGKGRRGDKWGLDQACLDKFMAALHACLKREKRVTAYDQQEEQRWKVMRRSEGCCEDKGISFGKRWEI
jgi:hypothetical protein